MFLTCLLQGGSGFGGDSQDISELAYTGTNNNRTHGADYRPTAKVYQNYRADTTVNHVMRRGLKTDTPVAF